MVRRHRVDLGSPSILALTDLLVATLEDSAQRVLRIAVGLATRAGGAADDH